ncbi:putative calmodulin-dependent protein kinase type 1 [Favolaschia claudopus]|uniref:Calmodulin-dependent protein kinase type 1 n=1 Tax=Favolaschia claudopus TaxID=2862362 RepID=A0AAW0DJ77_9AGAR
MRCKYRTGKLLGEGTYADIREAMNMDTGQVYACKIMEKKYMRDKWEMVNNEIEVLNRLSNDHPNIVTLHDYFESPNHLYLCFDLCKGGDLFSRISSKGPYPEAAAASLIHTILSAVQYIHDAGIVHGDLKPENLLFRTAAADDDSGSDGNSIVIADFGLSRLVGENPRPIKSASGTLPYMAPETLRGAHGKPVDIWAMGVIAYYILVGYPAFHRSLPSSPSSSSSSSSSQPQSHQSTEEHTALITEAHKSAILARDVRFPEEEWGGFSHAARGFVEACLVLEPGERPGAGEVLRHSWLASIVQNSLSSKSASEEMDLPPAVREVLEERLDGDGSEDEDEDDKTPTQNEIRRERTTLPRQRTEPAGLERG